VGKSLCSAGIIKKMEQEIEVWKDVLEYDGRYQVSNLGRIKSIRKLKSQTSIKKYGKLQIENILKPEFSKDYFRIMLSTAGETKRFQVHRLVLASFSRVPLLGEEGNHLDGNTKNNKLDNLEWTTKRGNVEHRIRIGKYLSQSGENQCFSKLKTQNVIDIRRLRKEGISARELGKRFGVEESSIRNIVNYKSWKHVQ
jgi:hypothetical protein